MKRQVKAVDVIGEACAQALARGETDWTSIRSAIDKRLDDMEAEDRAFMMRELNLMLSREEDQTHQAVKH